MAFMQNYLEQFNARAEQQSQPIKADTQQRPFKPLTDQISDLMKSMPPSMLNRPWSMSELVLRLEGKYRDRPHAQQVGDALKVLGWQRVRYWARGYDGVRLWLPPYEIE